MMRLAGICAGGPVDGLIPHPLLPQSEVAKDALDDLPVINERDNPHLVRTEA